MSLFELPAEIRQIIWKQVIPNTERASVQSIVRAIIKISLVRKEASRDMIEYWEMLDKNIGTADKIPYIVTKDYTVVPNALREISEDRPCDRVKAFFIIDKIKITQSTAISDFMLAKKDLESIPCQFVRNPHYRSAPDMKLFKLSAIMDLTRAKYGSSQNMSQIADKKRMAAVTRHENKKKKELSRTQDLTSALKSKGLDMRTDSRLCEEYCRKGKGDVEDIAVTMEQMKFFHENTEYRKCFRKIVSDHRDFGDRYDHDEVSGMAKVQAIKLFKKQSRKMRAGVHIPDSLMHEICASK